jgi:hypothetical protein
LRNAKDFYAGLLFALAGGAFGWAATGYPLGDSGRMGPGFFPLLLGALLAVLGSVMMFKVIVLQPGSSEKVGRLAWKPLVFIIAANLIFGLALGGLPSWGVPAPGLIAGVYLLTLVACVAGDRFNLKEALVLATLLAALSYVAFVLLLKLQLPVWPAFGAP